MNKLVFLSLTTFVSMTFAQSNFNDCSDFTSSKALRKYNELKHLGVNYKMPKGNQDVIPIMIQVLGENGIKQVCIDTSYDNYRRGIENNYKRYIDIVKYISKQDYMNNYLYLEIFNRMVSVLEQNSNYKRMR